MFIDTHIHESKYLLDNHVSLDELIVAFGIDDLPKEKLHTTELISYINAKEGVGISAHPFCNNSRGLGDGCTLLDYVRCGSDRK